MSFEENRSQWETTFDKGGSPFVETMVSHSTFEESHENPPKLEPLQIITDYTPRSHVLCGIALKDVYANFRVTILREVEWATWHVKMKIPGGKGWCIRKSNLPDLERELRNASISYEITEYVRPIRQERPRKTRTPKIKGVTSAYNFYTKEMWADKEELVKTLGTDSKNPGIVSSYIARRWKEVNVGYTKWHFMAENEKRERESSQKS